MWTSVSQFVILKVEKRIAETIFKYGHAMHLRKKRNPDFDTILFAKKKFFSKIQDFATSLTPR